MIMPYLSFQGNCEEAFLWYQKIFNGQIEHLARYEEIGNSLELTADQKRQIMHCQLKLTDEGFISGSDSFQPVSTGNTLAIHVHLPDEKNANKVFQALATEGVILSPLATNPPPDNHGISGSVTDKFGFTWIVSALNN